jgi:DNA repair exonuclease SbcCD ATPase subunit
MLKQIVLRALILKNFKGIKDLTINFGPTTDIYGDNGTGKTTIFDAFTWLLFDKDSNDRKNFEIKTLDKTNRVLHGLEHQVTGLLLVDGKEITLTKIHREKWTKKKGEADRTLTGNETLYYIDDIPVKLTEYHERVNGIINENIFKLITSPLYFSTNMKWQQRRDVILQIIGDIAAERIFNYKRGLKKLEKLLFDKDIDTLRKSIAARKSKLNKDIKAIPYRIDELNNSLQELNFTAVELELSQYKTCLKDVEEKLLGIHQAPLKELYTELDNCEKQAARLENQAFTTRHKLQSLEEDIAEIEKLLQQLRQQWNEINEEALELPEDSGLCPTCGQPLSPEDIERKRLQSYENANRSKEKKLADINATGKAKKEKCKQLINEAETLKNNLELINEKHERIKSERAELEERLKQPVAYSEEINKLKESKADFTKKIDECKKLLAVKEQNERFSTRITELLEEEKSLAKQIAELEGQEFLCEEFIKTKVELLERSINSKFKFVTFKLFNNLVNGSVEECCEALIEGVPFSNANTASQINAGLDIINALSEHYGVSAPIFIDNRESINKIIASDSQIINLMVSNHKELLVETIESSEEKLKATEGAETIKYQGSLEGPGF